MNEGPPNWVRLWDRLVKDAEELKNLKQTKKDGGSL